MKTDRLLSIVIYLLNRERASAREMAERFCVSHRTIQRDIEAIELAGIPVFAVQGAGGGYGILDSFKMDRQLMTVEDFYYIVTALESIGSSLNDDQINSTLEKVRTLIPDRGLDFLAGKSGKLSIDFSMLGGDPRHRAIFQTVRDAVDRGCLLRFSYTNNKLESTSRIVEPMTIVFRWRSWYLYGYCRLKGDYRLFRISRIRDPEPLRERFVRRDRSFEEFAAVTGTSPAGNVLDLVLRFSSAMKPVVEEFYPDEARAVQPDGSVIVNARMPEDNWVYGYILSFGEHVEVLSPPRLRTIITDSARKITEMYASAT
ncbi:MAG: YafY family transcriptional regulator [Spirochaetaceae bacterium]|nr:MAG: YafY family transcriptional regulator [Spirochaetaceae bacterium]